jgi:hypothetical protein
MTDDRDFSWLGRTSAPNPSYPEHFVWALEKAARRTEARTRAVPNGVELRIYVDGELWWSRVVRDLAALESLADEQRLAFEGKGWTRPGPRP